MSITHDSDTHSGLCKSPQDRVQRLKDARTEATKEIDEYRRVKETEFKAFEASVSPGSVCAYIHISHITTARRQHLQRPSSSRQRNRAKAGDYHSSIRDQQRQRRTKTPRSRRPHQTRTTSEPHQGRWRRRGTVVAYTYVYPQSRYLAMPIHRYNMLHR